ncbi:MAG: glycosyltransferase [Bacteroidota bacterium]
MSIHPSLVCLIIPCFNERETILRFLDEVFEISDQLSTEFRVVVIDDGSIDNTLDLLIEYKAQHKRENLIIIPLDFNVGHQKAIYQGLLYANQQNFEHAIIMDGDGEDDPKAIPRLLEMASDYDIIHVKRGKRKESVWFRLAYKIYKLLFWFITRKSMTFGNYCLISKKVIKNLKEVSFIHLAAKLSKLKVKSSKITYDRRSRIDGKSKMNLNSLIVHAFLSFIEYSNELLMMFLRLFILLIFIFSLSIATIIYLKLFTDQAILGWASNLTLGFLNASLICLGIFLIGLLILNLMQKMENHQKQLFTAIH